MAAAGVILFIASSRALYALLAMSHL